MQRLRILPTRLKNSRNNHVKNEETHCIKMPTELLYTYWA